MKAQDRIHAKVRLLLAKAESTEYPDEAAAYTAKAQELITLHAIDLALVEEREGKGQIITRLVDVPSPYPKEKFILLGGIARANNCRAILGVERDTLRQMMADDSSFFEHKGRLATVVGYESDLDAVDMLFTSLLVQAVNEMLAHGSQINAWGENRTKSFRRSFLYQFACTVSKRLAEATDVVRKDAVESGETLLPVLVGREEAVESELNERFPHVRTLQHSVSNYDGVVAGDAAGRRADIGTRNLRGRRSALPG